MSFEHHAAAPPGEWINDPNGLIFRDGQWRLFVQHSAAAPDFASIGWARLSSPDLKHWTWDGQVIAPNALGQAYSGSVIAEGRQLAAYLTRHDGKVQRQVRLASDDNGLTWSEGPPLGPEGRNVRDPFVFFCRATGDWRMLVAEPCDWSDWSSDAPSRLSVWRREGDQWQPCGSIGPWLPQGIMWEVPVLIDFGDTQALIVSLIDRREGRTACSVRYWLGWFDGCDFRASSSPDGILLDHGPDFYAAIVAMDDAREPILLAWASNWSTARTTVWPAGARGGPITLPRRLAYDAEAGKLRQSPIPDLAPSRSWHWDGEDSCVITIDGTNCALTLRFDRHGVAVDREGNALDWSRNAEVLLPGAQTIDLFEDAGLLEFFIRPAGISVTSFLPGARL